MNATDKVMLKMHLKQSGFTYSAQGAFIKKQRKNTKIIEIGDSRYISQSKLVFDLADMQLVSKYNDRVRFLQRLLIFTAKAPGLFRWGTRKALQSPMNFKTFGLV